MTTGEVEYGGWVYVLRKPTRKEQAAFLRWARQHTNTNPQRWGDAGCNSVLGTPEGLVALVGIVCAVDSETAAGIVRKRLSESTAELIEANRTDPAKAAAMCVAADLPHDFLSDNFQPGTGG